MMTKIEGILNDMENGNCSIYGVRTDSKLYNVGDWCEKSLDTCDGEILGELEGTSATGFGYLYFDGDQEDIDEVKRLLNLIGGFTKQKKVQNANTLLAATNMTMETAITRSSLKMQK